MQRENRLLTKEAGNFVYSTSCFGRLPAVIKRLFLASDLKLWRAVKCLIYHSLWPLCEEESFCAFIQLIPAVQRHEALHEPQDREAETLEMLW